jgi:hypothetical protein
VAFIFGRPVDSQEFGLGKIRKNPKFKPTKHLDLKKRFSILIYSHFLKFNSPKIRKKTNL